MKPTLLALVSALLLPLGAIAAAPFADTDVGAPAVAGSLSAQDGGFGLTAGGKDVWGTSDQFHFAYVQRKGDFDAAVRIAGFTPAQLYSRIGLMARETLAPSSRHVFFVAFADNQPRHNNNAGYEFQFRPAAGGKSQAIYPPALGDISAFMVSYPSAWLRLTRADNTFTAYVSTNGKTWTKFGTQTLVLPPTVYLGVALTAHEPQGEAHASFADFSVTP